jgi:cytochrome d ubiquinol oxidase subunit II
MISTIGPIWDGNEVWVIVAGGAMFAAFPGWYATVFSAFYLPLLVILVGLIIRVVAFEYRDHHDDPRWRRRWDLCQIAGSTIPAFSWGLIFGNIVAGLPLNGTGDFTGSPLDLINPFAVLTGLATMSLFIAHGATFLALKTTGDLRLRAKRAAGIGGLVAAVIGVATLLWLTLSPTTGNRGLVAVCAVIAAAALVFALLTHRTDHDGWSFGGTAVAIAGVVLALFISLYPRLLPSTGGAVTDLTIHNASASQYTLTIMSWSALGLIPLVLLYQGWTYWVFRKRVTVEPASVPAGEAVGAATTEVTR